MTRAKARQQLEERIQQKEKEITSGTKSHDLELVEVKATVDGTGPKKGASEPSCGLGLPVSGEELKTLQKQDEKEMEITSGTKSYDLELVEVKATVVGTGLRKGAGEPSCGLGLPVSGEELKTLQKQDEKEMEITSGTKSHDLELVEVKATVDGTGPRKGAGEPSCGLRLPVSGEELKTLQKQDETEMEITSGTKSHDLELVEVKATVDRTGPRKGAGEPSCGLGLPVSGEELKTLQKQDETLAEAWRAAEKSPKTNETGYFKEDGVLYRRWVPTGRPEMSIEQLVLPKRCRRTVLEMAHEIPISGHQGKEKTRQRVLRRFFWPSVYKDIEGYCRSCRICQKTTHSVGTRAPLIPLPIISEPFSRMAMDIVGPLPRSRSGNRYVLVMCDYATRYLEAIPLKSIDAEHIAEKMIEVFARVGVPREILTDQGSNFVSQLLAELYRLLQVKPIRTSPYHPQTDGLVERFNKTLKAMLRKTASEDGKDWDRMIPYLLFAYREVPQSSTGFSPFELLYGRDVRGRLDVLKETWEAGQKSEESVVSYVMSTQQKLKEMAECVKENMLEKQDKQKQWYDVKARLREFKAGDPVLVLLPTSTNKLLAQWQGPYQVLERMGQVTYLATCMFDSLSRLATTSCCWRGGMECDRSVTCQRSNLNGPVKGLT